MKPGDLVQVIPNTTWLWEALSQDYRSFIENKLGLIIEEEISARKLKAIPDYYGPKFKVLIEDRIFGLYQIEMAKL